MSASQISILRLQIKEWCVKPRTVEVIDDRNVAVCYDEVHGSVGVSLIAPDSLEQQT